MNIYRLSSLAFFFSLLLHFVPDLHGEENAGRAVLQKMVDAREINDSVSMLDMTITNAKGKSRHRKIMAHSLETSDGLQKGLIKFLEPSDVRGTGFLTLENKDRDNDQFIYFPAFNKTKRIASSQQGDRFMGSDFSYEDLQPFDLDEGTHRILKEQTINGIETDVVETLVTDADSQYGKVETWVRRDNHLPLQIRFYNKKMKPLKRLLMLAFDTVDKKPVITKMKMENAKTKGHTVMETKELKLNQNLSDSLFTQRSLEKPL